LKLPFIVMKGLVLTAALLAAVACGGRSRGTDGAALYGQTCARCHGVDGTGDELARKQLGVPDMTDPLWQKRLTDGDIRRTIQEGSRSKKMPPLGGMYDDAQLGTLVEHVRSMRRAPR
jgi:mono/diheme cytochrome c family protein